MACEYVPWCKRKATQRTESGKTYCPMHLARVLWNRAWLIAKYADKVVNRDMQAVHATGD